MPRNSRPAFPFSTRFSTSLAFVLALTAFSIKLATFNRDPVPQPRRNLSRLYLCMCSMHRPTPSRSCNRAHDRALLVPSANRYRVAQFTHVVEEALPYRVSYGFQANPFAAASIEFQISSESDPIKVTKFCNSSPILTTRTVSNMSRVTADAKEICERD